MSSPRWTVVSESAYPWEAEAIAWLRERQPESDAYHGWSNLEFVAPAGSANDVDALLLTPTKLVLLEIKSRPGLVTGDTGAWTWAGTDGRQRVDENPLILANRKAKRLASLLRGTKALKGRSSPYVEDAVLLSHKDLRCEFTGAAGTRVFLRTAGKQANRDIVAYLDASAADALGGRMDWSPLGAVGRQLASRSGIPLARHRTRDRGKARRDAALREFRLLARQDQQPGILRVAGWASCC